MKNNKLMEANVISISVHSRGCVGCIRHKSDIMITLTTPPTVENTIRGYEEEFNDFFLSTKQAESLVAQLQKRLKQNE